jgi:hypothetical protein
MKLQSQTGGLGVAATSCRYRALLFWRVGFFDE